MAATTRGDLARVFGGAVVLGFMGALCWGALYAWGHRPGLCASKVEAALRRANPLEDPVVEKCEYQDDPKRAICFVRRLEDGQPRIRPIYRDCTPTSPAKMIDDFMKN